MVTKKAYSGVNWLITNKFAVDHDHMFAYKCALAAGCVLAIVRAAAKTRLVAQFGCTTAALVQ